MAAARVDGDVEECLRLAASSTDPARVLEQVKLHGCLGLLASKVAEHSNCWPELHEALHPLFLRHAAWTLVMAYELRQLVEALDDAGISYAVVKGPVLAGHAYGALDQRTFSDLDLMVSYDGAPVVLEALGATVVPVDAVEHAGERGLGEVTAVLPRGTTLDLHWELINDPTVRRDFNLNLEDALGRVRVVDIEGQPVATLDPVDTLLHLASHTAVSGGHRLQWYCDLDRVVRRDGIDVDTLIGRAAATGLGTSLAVLLRRCQRQLGTPLPAGLTHALSNSRLWTATGRCLDAVTPLSSSSSRRFHGQVYFRSTRPTLGRSLSAARQLTKEIRAH